MTYLPMDLFILDCLFFRIIIFWCMQDCVLPMEFCLDTYFTLYVIFTV